MGTGNGPHRGGRVLELGTEAGASAAVILLHGRHDSPERIAELAPRLGERSRWFLAPSAAGGSWYPHSFLEPVERNQPWLDSALAAVDEVVHRVDRAGLPRSRTALVGFSQGACLALEYLARRPARYGAVIGLIGGLIGPPDHTGRLDGTPVLLACGDSDDHVPVARVRETASVLTGMGARVRLEVRPGGAHEIDDTEIAAAAELLDSMTQP